MSTDPILNATVASCALAADPGVESDDAPSLLVAVVHTRDAVRFVTATTVRAELVRRLAGYVAERAPTTLHEADAARLDALLAGGEAEAAVAHYFDTVGRRWDEEWLVTTDVDGRMIPPSGASAIAA